MRTSQRVLRFAALAALLLAPRAVRPLAAATLPAENGFQLVDLAPAANMGWRDDAAGDGKGGWSDQGDNDMRTVQPGTPTLVGVPFRLLDPAANAGRAVLALKSTHLPTAAEKAVVEIGTRAASVYILHAAAWAKGPLGTYVIAYADGTTVEIPVRAGEEVCDWWSPRHGATYRAALLQHNAQGVQVGMVAFGWANPSPDKPIRSLEFRSAGGDGLLIVAAVTLSDRPLALPDAATLPAPGYARTDPDPAAPADPDAFIWIEGERFSSSNLPEQKPVGDYGRRFSESDALVFELPSTEEPPPGPGRVTHAEGVYKLEYRFEARRAADYAVWARLGPDGVYCAFRWRIDEGPWQTLTREMALLDLFEIGTFWTFGWVNLGNATVAAGAHTLRIEVPNPARQEGDALSDAAIDDVLLDGMPPAPAADGKDAKAAKGPRWLVGIDCLTLTAIPFSPSGKLKPGERYDDPLSKEARATWLDFSGAPLSPAGDRDLFRLDGLWEMARDQTPQPGLGGPAPDPEGRRRQPIRDLPPNGTLRWMGVNVPHLTPTDDALLHQSWYRKVVKLPADARGKRFSLHVSECNYTSSIFVNGRLVGVHEGGYVPFSVDISDALRPGERNEILIGVKGLYLFMNRFHPGLPRDRLRGSRRFLVPGFPGWSGDTPDGLAGSVWLESHGPVTGHDVYVRSHYAARKLSASVEVDNRSGAPFEGKVVFGVSEPEAETPFLALGEAPLALAAGTGTVVSVEGSAEGLTPWWPAQPRLYGIVARIVDREGRVIDTCRDRFGFREVALRDHYFLINDKRFNFRDIITGGERTLAESVARWKEYNCNFLRTPHTGFFKYFRTRPEESFLDYADEQGIPLRHCSMINGMFITVDNFNPEFWQRCAHYFRQFVKAYRNHPSIIAWVAENEVDLISNMGNRPESKRMQWDMMKTSHEVDPSRPVMADGAGDLLGECEICNWHYPEVSPIVDPNNAEAIREQQSTSGMALYPDNAYTLARQNRREAVMRPWDRKRPLWVGETYFYSGTIAKQAWIGGDEPFEGRFKADEASARFVDMLGRGYRWVEAAGFDLFLHYGRLPGDSIKRTLAPLAVFPYEYNWNFHAGTNVTRRIRIFNDTLDAAPISLRWTLRVDGTDVASDVSEHTIIEGFNQELTIAFRTPDSVPARTDGALVLELRRGGAVAFREEHALSVFPARPALALPAGKSLLVYDPQGRVAARLGAWNVPFTAAPRLPASVPPDAALIVGGNALAESDRAAFAGLAASVQEGAGVLVLEQAKPVPAAWLPLPCPSSEVTGAFAFPRGTHPMLAGLRTYDLSCWADGHVAYRGAYRKNPDWVCVADASERDKLELAPIVEQAWGKGRYILSQMCIAEKAGREPVADALLAGALRQLLSRPAAPAPLKVLPDEKSGVEVLLAAAKVPFRKASQADAVNAMLLYADGGVIVVGGSARNVEMFASTRAELRRFAEAGGWLVIQRLDPAALPHLSRLVGEELELRPVGLERIRAIGRADPLLAGIGHNDFYREQNLTAKEAEEARFLHGDLPLINNVLEGALYYEDICRMAGGSEQVANQLTNEDHWQYILYGGETLKLDWRKPVEIRRVVVRESRSYHRMRKISLTLDDAAQPLLVREVPDAREPIVFEFPPQTARSITLKAVEHEATDPTRAYGPFGWDTVEIDRVLSDAFRQNVVPLTSPAGIVKFPIGKGGVLLNLMPLGSAQGNRVFLQILHNMGVARGKPSSAAGQPAPKDEVMDILGDDFKLDD